MDNLQWLKIKVLYSLTSGIDEEELSDIDIIRLKNEGFEDGHEIGTAIFNLSIDPIMYLEPRSFVPKEKSNKKYYTKITFESGNFICAVGKPEDIYDEICVYANELTKK